MVAIDAEEKVTLINQRGCEVLGYREEEIVGANWFDCFIPERIRGEIREVFRGLMEGRVRPLEWVENFVVTKDGSQRIILWHNTVLTDEVGKITGMLRSGEDITEREAAAEELRRLEAQLAHVGRLSVMGEMVAGIAHEVNQPLYSILNFAKASGNLLAGAGEPNVGDLRQWNEEIMRAAARAGQILSRLRSFARRVEPRRSLVDVGEVVGQAVELAAFENRGREVAVEIDSSPEVLFVRAHRVQIQQVLLNLLRNAHEAAEQGGAAAPQVRIRTCRSGESVEVSVADNGPGLLPEEDSRIFEPFVTTKADGLGMGLAISKTIVEAHGGRLWASSTEGGGATFRFALPAVEGGKGNVG
jgi:two-component system sensor kinase FixL